jgi:hypothetical protein
MTPDENLECEISSESENGGPANELHNSQVDMLCISVDRSPVADELESQLP